MYTSIRWGWWNGDLWVFRRDEGHSRSDDAKIGNFTIRPRLKVCTLHPTPPVGGVRTPWLLRELATF